MKSYFTVQETHGQTDIWRYVNIFGDQGNVIKTNCTEIQFQTHLTNIFNSDNAMCWRGYGFTGSLIHIDGNVNQFGIISLNWTLTYYITQQFHSQVYTEEILTHVQPEICIIKLGAAVFPKAKMWKQPKQPSIRKCIKYAIVTQWKTMEPSKRMNNSIWMNLSNLILRNIKITSYRKHSSYFSSSSHFKKMFKTTNKQCMVKELAYWLQGVLVATSDNHICILEKVFGLQCERVTGLEANMRQRDHSGKLLTGPSRAEERRTWTTTNGSKKRQERKRSKAVQSYDQQALVPNQI